MDSVFLALWENVYQFSRASPNRPPLLGQDPADPELMAKPGVGVAKEQFADYVGVLGGIPLMSSSLGQTHGSLLRLHQVSPVDSGEYVCRVEGGPVPLESSVLVSIEPAGSGK